MRTLLLFLCGGMALAQTNLITPSTILPRADKSATGLLRFRDLGAPPHYVILRAPSSLAADIAWTWPTSDASGCLASDGAGTLSIVECGGGGGGAYLPLSGSAAMTGTIKGGGVSHVTDIGDTTNYFTDAHFSGMVEAATLSTYYGPIGSHTDHFDWKNSAANQLDLLDHTGTWRLRYNLTGPRGFSIPVFTIDGDVLPSTTRSYNMGSLTAPWNGYFNSLNGSTVTVTDLVVTHSCDGCSSVTLPTEVMLTNTAQTITSAGTKTFQSSLLASGIVNIGTAAGPWDTGYIKTEMSENLKIAVPGTNFGTFWMFSYPAASQFLLTDNIGNRVFQIAPAGANNYQFGIYGTIYPLDRTAPDGDLGYIGVPWNRLYLATGLYMNGSSVIDASRNMTVNTLTCTSTPCGSGGATPPANMATTDTAQTISGQKLFTQSILGNGAVDVGISSSYFNNGNFGGTLQAARLRFFNGALATPTDYFDWVNSSANQLDLQDRSGTVRMQYKKTGPRGFAIPEFNFTADLDPQTSGQYNLGNSSYYWNNLYLNSSVYVGGTEVINSLKQFVGNGINVGSNGISAGGYNVAGGFAGQTWNIPIPGFSFLGCTQGIVVRAGIIVSCF